MYHHSASRRGGRAGHRASSHCPAQPSNAAAAAAAAAKALHRRAQARAREKQKEGKQRAEDGRCCKSTRNRPDRTKDVFRRNPHNITRDAGGSILKRLTTGNHQLFRTGPSTLTDNSYELSLADKAKAIESGLNFSHHTLSSTSSAHIPVNGMSGAYLVPSGHHGHERFVMHHHTEGVGDSIRKGIALDQHHCNETMKAKFQAYPRSHTEVSSMEPQQTSTHHPPGHYCPQTVPQNVSTSVNCGTVEMEKPDHLDSSGCCFTTSSDKTKSKSVSILARADLTPHFSRSTCRVIGSHTPIHVPRAASHKASDPPPRTNSTKTNAGNDPGSVFRSSERTPARRSNKTLLDEADHVGESNAHQILLSLSKSFDHGVEVECLEEENVEASFSPSSEERPKSPDEPPRIQHWHKQSSDSFEPQPSPLKLSYLKEADAINIDLTSSFTLFNESFDMNIEGLLGPNASFGLGPMRSLSFGLGLGATAENMEDPRPINLYSSLSHIAVGEDVAHQMAEGTSNHVDLFDAKKATGVMSGARAFPSNSTPDSSKPGKTGVGIDSVVVNTHSKQAEPAPVLSSSQEASAKGVKSTLQIDSNRQHDSFRIRSTGDSLCQVQSPPKPGPEGPVRDPSDTHQHQPWRKIEPSLFGAMEKHHALFNRFSFLLPGAKVVLNNDITLDQSRDVSVPKYCKLSENEEEVARRRVNSALCAFGGVVIPHVFEGMYEAPKQRKRTHQYTELIPERFYEDESRLSWEIEEEPPIEVSDSEGEVGFSPNSHSQRNSNNDKLRPHCCQGYDSQNCVETSLQRSIGVMVYPAVNAFTATEPGIITPALCDMNNFVDGSKSIPELTPAKIQGLKHLGTNSFPPMVSPDTMRPGTQGAKLGTFLGKKTPQRSMNYAGGAWISNLHSPGKVSPGQESDCYVADLLFVDIQELQPEQYRIITRKKQKLSSTRYFYPALPMPYGQRKRISNAMFAMSKSIPGLTDECASVLGEARQQNAWDFAVAQLMTQVIVVTHCSADDDRLDGLSRYLLTLGIAC